MCGKLKIGSDSVSKEPNRPKIRHLFRWFSNRNRVQSTIQIKSDKNNFTCIQCADRERCKTLPKQGLAFRFFINYSIKAWYAQYIQHASNAVIFAVN